MHMEDHVICSIFHHNMTVHLMVGTMEVGVAKSKAHFRTMLFASLFFLTCGMVLEGMHFLIKGEIQAACIQWKLL